MSLPSGVPSNSTNVGEETFTVPSSVMNATLRLTTQVVVNNTTSSGVPVQAYVVLDLNTSNAIEVDTLPLVFPPGQNRLEFTTLITGLAAGNHALDLYLYCNVGGVNWIWSRFIGQLFLA